MMQEDAGFSENATNGNEIRKLSCNFCDFTNTNKGGMTRHIQHSHKGSKRSHQDNTNEELSDDIEEKRPKLDDEFEPVHASTQLSDDDDNFEGLDEFEEALLAEENDLDATAATVAALSNESIARLGATQTQDEGHTPWDSIVNKALQAEADVVVTNSRLKGMENASNMKDLLLAEKESELSSLKVENEDLKKAIDRKDNALKTNLEKLNSVEEELLGLKNKDAKKKERIQLLEKALKKFMNKASSDSPKPSDVSGNDEVMKLKEIIAKKSKEIKELVKDKITLANELKVAQEKTGGESLALEKCTKLTNDLKTKTSELKAAEKEKAQLKGSTGKFQTEMNARNNKIAVLEAENVKLNDFNNKMYEICKKTGVFEKLETLDINEADKNKEPQEKVVFPLSKESVGSGATPRHGNKPKSPPNKQNKKKSSQHCWYHENGFCRKGGRCEFSHPLKMCPSFWKKGECQKAGECPDRHPVQVCHRYLNDKCFAGKNCFHQHPSKIEAHSSPKSPANFEEPVSYYNNVDGTRNTPSNQSPQYHQDQSPMRIGSPQVIQQSQHRPQFYQHPYAPQQFPQEGNFSSHPGQSQGQGWQM